MQPAPGQPGSDQLPFMLAHDPGWRMCETGGAFNNCAVDGSKHTRRCSARWADEERARELAGSLQPEDIRWLNDQGWDGRFYG